jgi:hypothetical protein
VTTPSLFDVEQADGGAQDRALVMAFHSSRSTSCTCRACGEPITFYRLVASGKWMPFDGDPAVIKTSLDAETQKLIAHLDPADAHRETCARMSSRRT